ncbi:hypothetical protein FOIG_10362 [Fusarium odoratissimum NRRL 54006]|uniref:Apple domain-containing protein n=1 Tax=Fusarium odoratissimum (strain NRRL 54006) TaxID=1089451 RepID=X0KKH1_FUSO5|nr:uncharacterized protein FOIG_10362 [Fusarium odoratissimum NRRL 54006]EXL97314.1 hypothetical protein FOIG_10362 [Fusarium odoratissimum NRRL 54006]
MARHFVRSFVIAAALSPFVNAGPCRPSSSSVAVVTTTAETSVATGSATTHTKDSSLTESLSGTSTETSLIVSESGSTTGASTETSLTISESDSSTGTTLGTTTSTECTEPEPPVYNDPFTATYTEEIPATTTEAATTTEDAAATIVPRNFVRRGHPEIFVRDATSEAAPANSEDATTTEEATTTTEETTTTASETATGCVNNMERPTPEGAVCGARGYVWGVSDEWRSLGEGSSSSLMDCYKSCMETSNCVTFLYQKDAQCSLYRGKITQLSSDRTSVRNYEISCFCDTGIEPAPTCSYDTSIINGGFDNGKFSPWQEDPNPGGKDPVALRPVPGGEGGTSYRLQTGQFDFDKSMWIYQDVKACPGTTFYCSYRWWWDEYYSIPQNSGGSLVPYVRVYQDDDRIGNRYPTSAAQTKTWINANFQFTMPDSGETRIWFVASSPQGEWINNSDDPCTPDWVHRPNSFALDSVYCRS